LQPQHNNKKKERKKKKKNRTKQSVLFLAMLWIGYDEMTSQPTVENYTFVSVADVCVCVCVCFPTMNMPEKQQNKNAK
jgi:hypothetical protein